MYPSWIFCLLCIVIAQNCAIFTKDYKPIDFQNMVNICNSEQHVVLMRILDARNRPSITPDMPLWKLKLTEEEYTNLKETLVQNAYRLEDFGIEAALCYAEWWRRD